MPFGQKLLEALRAADIHSLVDHQVIEGKEIDYKEALHSTSDGEKKEFFADVSSFANSSGGWLVWGIVDKKGVPVSVTGLELENPDRTIVSLENSLLDAIEPRISVYTRAIALHDGKWALVMRIPRSWNAPHRIKFQRWAKFWSRTSNGKYEMDVNEIRAAFLRSESLVERVRAFRVGRVEHIQSGETPVPVIEGARIALHLIPLQAFDATAVYDVAGLQSNANVYSRLYPIYGRGHSSRHNFDGFLTYAQGSGTKVDGYVQVFRNGIIEAVDGSILRADPQARATIPSVLYERELVQSLPRYLAVQEALGIVPPVVVLLTLVDVRGYLMAVDPSRFFADYQPIDRDVLDVPETLIESYDGDAAQVLRPLFDTVWNATGWPRSMNYDEQSNWLFNER